MKAGKKVLAMFLAATSVCGVFGATACSKETETFDDTKSQLFVKYYNGGVGRAWIDEIIAEFEEEYAEVEFEPGKKGVQVVKDFEKSIINVNNVKNDINQVYILVNTVYSEFVANDAMMDITDVVKGKALTTKGVEEDVTIESKFSDKRKSYYNIGTENAAKYYAIPFFESSMNLNYNVDLFEDFGYYFAAGQTAEGMTEAELHDFERVATLFVQSDDDERSLGPDNRTGVVDGVNYSLDDGLPATYADFQALITYIEADNIPFIWNGTATSYLTCFANEVWANSVGEAEYDMAFTFRGTSDTLMDLDANGEIQYNEDGTVKMLPADQEITPETAYKLHAQKGKYDALRFANMILSSDYYKDSFTVNYLDAQKYFIKSSEMKEFEYKGIAMMVEGTWWNNEARGIGYENDTDRKSYRFGVMPLPKPDASQLGENNTKISERESLMFINNYCDEYAIPIAKEFMRYLQSDRAMNVFSRHTDMLRAMKYDLTDDTLGEMTYFGKNVYEMSRAATTDWVEWMPKSEEAQKNRSLLDYLTWGYNTAQGSNPFELTYSYGTSPEAYFTNSYNYIKNNWNVKSGS
ncbi:MAG: hypothetical protein J6C79_03790 [Clostridia bacterium]|nr:hypothetical protein [Clostridia bacterium]